MSYPFPKTIIQVGKAMKAGTLSPTDVLEQCLERIETLDPAIGAFTCLDQRAVDEARLLTQECRSGHYRGPLHGIPIAIKDVIDVAGLPTRANSHVTNTAPARDDASCVARLRKAGAVILGKTVTHEFAYAGPPAELPFGAARNPWNPLRDTGGSSSGSGAAVAAGLCVAALGTDTGGSIRNPVSYCGGVGLKPTFGRVGRSGIIPLSWSFDTCGPMAWTVADCAIILQAIAGFDACDTGSSRADIPDFCARLGQPIEGWKIGIPRALYDYEGGASQEIKSALDAAADVFRDLGCTVLDVDLPSRDIFSACGRTIILSEAYALHFEDLMAVPESFGAWTRERLLRGRNISAKDYIQALRMRNKLHEAVNHVLNSCDALLTASALSQAPLLQMSGEDRHWRSVSPTIAFSLSGHPALAMTGGFSRDGLPLGFQLVGRAYGEVQLFQIAAAYENATRWLQQRQPAVTAS